MPYYTLETRLSIPSMAANERLHLRSILSVETLSNSHVANS